MRRLVIVLLGAFALTSLQAQQSDFGIWTFVGASKKLSKTVSLYGEMEMRSREDLRALDCWSWYIEPSVKIFPFLRAGAGYTYIYYNHPSTSWESKHRLNLFATGSYSVGQWSFAIRERYERVSRQIASKPKPKHTLRSRIEANYKIANSIFTPYATVELYTTLNDIAKNEKTRYTAGTLIAVNKRHSFSLYYRYIDSFAISATDSHILGVGFKFNL